MAIPKNFRIFATSNNKTINEEDEGERFMKAYTDIEQSRKLAEFLPIESADMEYLTIKENGTLVGAVPFVKDDSEVEDSAYNYAYNRTSCWSLTALFSVLPNFIGDYGKCLYYDVGGYYCGYMVDGDFMLTIEETKANNPIDACYKMGLKLHELNLL